jgi:hypothetical protein
MTFKLDKKQMSSIKKQFKDNNLDVIPFQKKRLKYTDDAINNNILENKINAVWNFEQGELVKVKPLSMIPKDQYHKLISYIVNYDNELQFENKTLNENDILFIVDNKPDFDNVYKKSYSFVLSKSFNQNGIICFHENIKIFVQADILMKV